MRKTVNVCLDSGAFSIYQKCQREGAKGDYYKTPSYKKYLERYMEYVWKNKDYLSFYINLDVIHNAPATYETQKYIESVGLHPVPVFHLGEDMSYLKKYLKNNSYIALGGLAKGVNKKDRVKFLDEVFSYAGKSSVRFHGLGITDSFLLKRYRWYSVDSTSLSAPVFFGGIFIPRLTLTGQEDYLGKDKHLRFSERSEDSLDNYKWVNPEDLAWVLGYLKRLGTTPGLLGESVEERVRCCAYYYRQKFKAINTYYETKDWHLNNLYIAGFWNSQREVSLQHTEYFGELDWLVSFAGAKHADQIIDIKKSLGTERKKRAIFR